MLYDQKWDQEVLQKIRPTKKGFIAWLEQQDPDARYDYQNCFGGCLIGLYLGSIGRKWVNSKTMGTRFYKRYEHIAVRQPWTFGAALKRLLAMEAAFSRRG